MSSVWERLYREKETRDALICSVRELRNQVEESAQQQLHQTTQKTLSTSRRPSEFHLIRGDERRQSRYRKYIDSGGGTFHPQILALSRKIAMRRNTGIRSVHERLYNMISPKTPTYGIEGPQVRTLLRENDDQDNLGFLLRQEADKEARQKKKEIRSRLLHEDCSFTPTINPRSEGLAAHRGRDGGIVRRLAVEDLKERQANSVKRLMLADPECKFIPEIDGFSDAIVTVRRVSDQSSVHDRLYSMVNKLKRDETTTIKQDVCPQIRSSRPKSCFDHVKSHYNLRNPDMTLAGIENARNDKESLREQAKREKEERELAECTFQPRVNKLKPESTRPILVAGLDKFVATQSSGRRMSASTRISELREYGSTNHQGTLTIPAPFVLSGTSD
jgi:hypothetical protein